MFDGVVKNLMNAGKGYHIKFCVMTSRWNSGFDRGKNVLKGFSTQDANYYLKEPHPNYKLFMFDTWEQAFLVKYMIEFLEGEDEGDEGTMMRRKMVFMKDFLITCLGCPHPDLRYQSSHPNLLLNTQSSLSARS